MDIDSYYYETPQDRRIRRHEEDKIDNPERHLFNKDKYTREEFTSKCIKCYEGNKNKYQYIHQYEQFLMIK